MSDDVDIAQGHRTVTQCQLERCLGEKQAWMRDHAACLAHLRACQAILGRMQHDMQGLIPSDDIDIALRFTGVADEPILGG